MERVRSVKHATVELTHALVLQGRTVLDENGDLYAKRVFADEVNADRLRTPYEPTLSESEKAVLRKLVGSINKHAAQGAISLGGTGNELFAEDTVAFGCVDCTAEEGGSNSTLVGCYDTSIASTAKNATVVGGNNVVVRGSDGLILGSNVRSDAKDSIVISALSDATTVAGEHQVFLCGSKGTAIMNPTRGMVVPPGFLSSKVRHEQGKQPVLVLWYRDTNGNLWSDERVLYPTEVGKV